MRSVSIFILFGMLILVTGLACQRGGVAGAPDATAAFPPGSVATQLARPTQERTPGAGEFPAPETTQPENQTDNPNQPAPNKTQEPLSDNDQYFLSASLLDVYVLDVRQQITYTNRTGAGLDDIWLVIEADRQEGVFVLEEMSWNGSDVLPTSTQGSMWEIALPEELAPGKIGVLEASYQLNLQANGGVLGYSRRQINFGDWYVRIPPFQPGAGWLVHPPGSAGEHNVYDMVDFHVQLDLGSVNQGLVIAASVPGQACGSQLCYTMLDSRGFAWSASSEYQVLEAVENGVLLQQFVFPEHSAAGLAALDAAGKAIKLFEEKFGDYPYPGLAMVEAGFFDGMEYSGLFFLGEEYYTTYAGTPAGYLTALTVHETAHQWWFSQVGSDQALDPWLDEALSTYSELIYYQEELSDYVDWWWEFRIERFQPGGYVDSSIYDHAGFRPYVNAVYLRGAQFMQELRVLMGEDAFKAFLAEYFNANEGRIATSEKFFGIAEQFVSAEELQAVRELYFLP